MKKTFTVELTAQQLSDIEDALGEAEYWRLGVHGTLFYNNGDTWLPEDFLSDNARAQHYPEAAERSEEMKHEIERARRYRHLQEMVRNHLAKQL